jgi:hypothetical protein
MEIQEELVEEEEECTVVRKLAHAESLDYIEDVMMQSDDGEDKGASFAVTATYLAMLNTIYMVLPCINKGIATAM